MRYTSRVRTATARYARRFSLLGGSSVSLDRDTIPRTGQVNGVKT